MAAILAAILEIKVAEDAPGPSLCRTGENRESPLPFRRSRHTHAHTHTHTQTDTQDSEKSPEFTLNGPVQAMNGCVGIVDN